jgi:hypothetical protein
MYGDDGFFLVPTDTDTSCSHALAWEPFILSFDLLVGILMVDRLVILHPVFTINRCDHELQTRFAIV